MRTLIRHPKPDDDTMQKLKEVIPNNTDANVDAYFLTSFCDMKTQYCLYQLVVYEAAFEGSWLSDFVT